MLATALRGHRCGRALQDLEQCLLHAFAGDIAGDRRILALASHLVDLVDVDDAGLGALHVVVGSLDELEEDVLDVLADVAGLSERRGVGNGEGDIEHARQGLRQQSLAGSRGAQQEDVGLSQFHRVVAAADIGAGLDALVVVVDGDGEGLLGDFLADDVTVEEFVDLARLGQLIERRIRRVVELLFDDLVAQIDALVADVDAGAGDELLDLLLALSAEGALEEVTPITDARHSNSFDLGQASALGVPTVPLTGPSWAALRPRRVQPVAEGPLLTCVRRAGRSCGKRSPDR